MISIGPTPAANAGASGPARRAWVAGLSSLIFIFLSLHSAAILSSHAQTKSTTNTISPDLIPPKIMREFRGAWIASYANIDWPSKPGLSVPEQKAELIKLMNQAVALRLNALILQVRPACDAFYQSSIEPWSVYLTGKMGEAPKESFDPLKFAVDEAHRRGLELHAWFNPYRAGLLSWQQISPRHIIKRQPNLVRRYGKFYWLDPSEPAVQDYTTRVVLDVVRRYDIDGVHMDDYFYPYPEKDAKGEVIDFPDSGPWKKYQRAGGKLSRGDWRRHNVNKLIQRLNSEIKREKKWVKFGVSPFGIWRPGFPQQIRGFDAYQFLYADARYWLINGWIDYLAPQLYWAIDPPAQSYSALLNWWQQQNEKQLAIWPGGAVTRVGTQWRADEIVRQIEIARATPTPGYIHWNLSSLARNPDRLADMLVQKAYNEPAIVPATTQNAPPARPKIAIEKNGSAESLLKWSLPPSDAVALWILQTKTDGKWHTEILPRSITSRSLKFEKNKPEVIALTALNRFRVLSPSALVTP